MCFLKAENVLIIKMVYREPGLLIYKFKTLKKGTSKIELIARHKGSDMEAEHLNDDDVTTINYPSFQSSNICICHFNGQNFAY